MSKHLTGGPNPNNNNKNNNFRVRAVSSANEPITYDISFQSILEAYEDCLSNKKGSPDFLNYLINSRTDIYCLWQEIRSGVYEPAPSKSFVLSWPVYREIFAAQFRDRIVHHWWALRVNPLFELRHIAIGDVAKNCRKGQGQHIAVKDAAKMVNQHPGWWIGHFDIEAFFISIDKPLLFEMLDIFIRENYKGEDLEVLMFITRKLVFNAPQANAMRIGPDFMWQNVPQYKSLFSRSLDKGCAIGNLPSQLNANFIGSVLDYWITQVKGIKNYLRFSDDILILLPDRKSFDQLLPEMRDFLESQLLLNLHQRKIYIQPARKGVLFVGAMILPGRTYVSNRTRGRMYDKLHYYNRLAEEGKALQYLDKFVQSMNSYLGMTVHHKAYNVRAKFVEHISPVWWQYVYMNAGFKALVIKKKYRHREILKQAVRNGKYKSLLAPELF